MDKKEVKLDDIKREDITVEEYKAHNPEQNFVKSIKIKHDGRTYILEVRKIKELMDNAQTLYAHPPNILFI